MTTPTPHIGECPVCHERERYLFTMTSGNISVISTPRCSRCLIQLVRNIDVIIENEVQENG